MPLLRSFHHFLAPYYKHLAPPEPVRQSETGVPPDVTHPVAPRERRSLTGAR